MIKYLRLYNTDREPASNSICLVSVCIAFLTNLQKWHTHTHTRTGKIEKVLLYERDDANESIVCVCKANVFAHGTLVYVHAFDP